ncbi:MAG TPA: protein-L-isoaspartate(D-aspartate) O-methyltransferase [Candidatus Limnocylindrales bacterium]|nr:protein-L-isoaspartate(D-aspartate) O-methyltransferase [Candidatus Limnocylindrales bacterium]
MCKLLSAAAAALVAIAAPATVALQMAVAADAATAETAADNGPAGAAQDADGGSAAASASAGEEAARKRRAMVETITAYSRMSGPPFSKRVLAAMAKVAREDFVPEDLRMRAYDDLPLPIGHGQTISQPYIVALMTELADVTAGEMVLEVGTGSGYQAAVLAELGAVVFTIEIVEPLAEQARTRLKGRGYDNVHVRAGDGYAGWPEHAPFDAVIVTAAPDRIPPPLIEQLASGGKLVVPVGEAGAVQQLTVVEKAADGSVAERAVTPVRFVPLTRPK